MTISYDIALKELYVTSLVKQNAVSNRLNRGMIKAIMSTVAQSNYSKLLDVDVIKKSR